MFIWSKSIFLPQVLQKLHIKKIVKYIYEGFKFTSQSSVENFEKYVRNWKVKQKVQQTKNNNHQRILLFYVTKTILDTLT